jgi:non-specific serine/threonine protein kinase
VAAQVEQSLLRQMLATEDEPRYQMLETVREYGVQQLTVAGERDDARANHARYFLALADRVLSDLKYPMDQPTLTRLAPDQDNVRLALAWFNEHDQIEALLQLSSLTYGLWFGRGLFREGLQWVERALERSQHAPSAARVRALDRAGTLAIFQGDYARAGIFIEEGVALARELGDSALFGEALTYCAVLAYRRREFSRAEDLLEEARRALGVPADQKQAILPFYFTLGDFALAQGQFDRAAQEYEAGIEYSRSAGNDWGLRDVQAGLAAVHYWTGDLLRSAGLYAESLQGSCSMHYWTLIPSALLGLSGIAVESGHSEVGARLLGAAEASAAALGTPIFIRDSAIHERVLSTLPVALGPERFAVMREAGRSLLREVAVSEALSVARTAMAAARTPHDAI